MRNILYYFYLLCFLILIGLGIASYMDNDSYIFSAVLLQLVWGPISALHCLFKVTQHAGNKTHIASLYKTSFGLTIAYFAILFAVVNLPSLSHFFEGDTIAFIGIGVIPWTMLAFFTFILHLEKNLIPVNHSNIEEDLID